MKPKHGSQNRRLSGSRLLLVVIIGLMASVPLRAFAQAASFSIPEIFDMRKNLPLEPSEPVFHDFYINAGPEAGFKKGMYVTVVRQIPVHDPVQNKQQAMLNVEVARLKIVHVQKNLTVARLHSLFGDEERPTLEFESVMIGDRIDPTTLTMEEPSKKLPGKKSALLMEDTTPTLRLQPGVPTNQGVATASAAVSSLSTASLSSESPSVVPVGASQSPSTEPVKNTSTNALVPDMVRIPVPGAAKTL